MHILVNKLDHALVFFFFFTVSYMNLVSKLETKTNIILKAMKTMLSKSRNLE